MKAVKINMNDAKTSKTIKSVIAGVLVNAAVVLITTILLTLFLSIAGKLFENVAIYLMLVPLILGGYAGGFTGARINGSNGLIMGVLTSSIVLIIMLIAGFAGYNTDITYMILIKAVCLVFSSILGGIKGVNKKEKFKI